MLFMANETVPLRSGTLFQSHGTDREIGEGITTMSLADNIDLLRAGFANLDRMDPDGPVYRGICAVLDSADDAALVAVRAADIKFVSRLALNRMIRRGLIVA